MAEQGNPSFPARLILVVEDSHDVGEVLAEALEEEGYDARVARTGGEALRLAQELRPDLITLDLGLPGKSGWDVLADLRADPATRHIPVVAVSAHANDLDAAFQAQFACVVPKPFYLSQVVEAVLQTLAGRQTPTEPANSAAPDTPTDPG